MRTKRAIAAVVLAALIQCGSSLAAQQSDARIGGVENGLRPYCWALFGDEPRLNFLERMKYYRVPGLSIAVIEHGKLAWARSYGVKNVETQEPVTVTTLFQAASISKALNDAVVLQEADEGKLDPDRDVNAYLKSWKVPSNRFTEKEKVTTARLMNHTAGVINFRDVTGYFGYKPGEPLPTIQQMLRGEPPAKTSAIVVERTPGETFSYSNGALTILQLLLMDIEGKPYEEIMKERLLDPLGMTNSIFAQPLPDSLKSRAASAHERSKPLEGGCMVYPELAASGLWTTPTDLAQFITAHWLALHGRPCTAISRKAAARMISGAAPGSDFAEGFELTPKGDQLYYGHRGGNYGFYSNMIINRDSGDGAIVMVNGGGDAVTSNLKREILIAIAEAYGWKDYQPPLLKVISVAPEKAARFAGRFRASEDNATEIREAGGKWTVDDPDSGTREVFAISDEELVGRTILPSRYTLVPGKDAAHDTLVITSGDAVVRAPRMSSDDKVPFEYLAAGDIDRAVDLYRALWKNDPSGADVREDRINRLGYALLGRSKTAAAIAILKLNTEWYPGSWNTYDSLGEAYAAAGDKERAIESYEKALELNPKSSSSAEALKRLSEGR